MTALFFIRTSIYKSKLKPRHKTLFFLDDRERLAIRRSGKFLFLPHTIFKQRENENSKLLFALHGGELFVGNSSWTYIQVKEPLFFYGEDESIWPRIEMVGSLNSQTFFLNVSRETFQQKKSEISPFFTISSLTTSRNFTALCIKSCLLRFSKKLFLR